MAACLGSLQEDMEVFCTLRWIPAPDGKLSLIGHSVGTE